MIEPGPSASDDPLRLAQQERASFLESLAPEAKERFLQAVIDAKQRGSSDEVAWEEAVIASETTYSPPAEITEETFVDREGNIVAEETVVDARDPREP